MGRHYYQQGTGIFASPALRWQQGGLVSIAHPDAVAVENLIGYEDQKQALLKNTEFLLQGLAGPPRLALRQSRLWQIFLWSKDCCTEYSDRGLRLIEVALGLT